MKIIEIMLKRLFFFSNNKARLSIQIEKYMYLFLTYFIFDLLLIV